jgi:hypothetical protein
MSKNAYETALGVDITAILTPFFLGRVRLRRQKP